MNIVFFKNYFGIEEKKNRLSYQKSRIKSEYDLYIEVLQNSEYG